MPAHRYGAIGAAGFLVFAFYGMNGVEAHEPHDCLIDVADAPTFEGHIEQYDINVGAYSFDDLLVIGGQLFNARFNRCDGQGRPATTGTGAKRVADEPNFNRVSGADSNACAGCHNQPESGGSGDFVANVFVLGQAADPILFSTDPEFSNSRNTLGMHGSGAIEMLAREMTADLRAQVAGLADGWHTLTTKGVNFDVEIEFGAVVDARGVDTDLIIKPFHQAGAVLSIREFTVNAMNHHHGIQAEERFDLNPAKGMDPDFDEDGVERELTLGDITATTIWQASLRAPVQVMPKMVSARQIVLRGERTFDDVGCTSCHLPEMILSSRDFSEPYALNPPGTWNDDTIPFTFDLTQKTGIKPGPGGTAIVRAYTDLKRHNLCDDESELDPIRYFCNEQLAQGRPDQGDKPGTEYFLTRKLWDVGNSAPYGHRGDITTIWEAIDVHGGEARAARDAYMSLPTNDQSEVVAFLKSLQVVTD